MPKIFACGACKSGSGVLLFSKFSPPPGGVLKFLKSDFPKVGPGYYRGGVLKVIPRYPVAILGHEILNNALAGCMTLLYGIREAYDTGTVSSRDMSSFRFDHDNDAVQPV